MIEIMNSWYILALIVLLAIAFGWTAYIAVSRSDALRVEKAKHELTLYYYRRFKEKIKDGRDFFDLSEKIDEYGSPKVIKKHYEDDEGDWNELMIGHDEWPDEYIARWGYYLQYRRSSDTDTSNEFIFDMLMAIASDYYEILDKKLRQGVDDWEIEGIPLDTLRRERVSLDEPDNGLYIVHWDSDAGGGYSLASIGRTPIGKIWIAPTNWLNNGLYSDVKRMVSKLEKIVV